VVRYSFPHFFECLFVFAGMTGISRQRYAQSWAANDAGFVVIEGPLLRVFGGKHLGSNRREVAPRPKKA
jgi:hypothetical protein